MYSEDHRKEKQREAQRKYRKLHAIELKAEAERIKTTGEMRAIWRDKTRRWRAKNPEASLKIGRKADLKRYHVTRAAAFEKLGNKCAHCGWTDT